jgi:hypothetical protein
LWPFHRAFRRIDHDHVKRRILGTYSPLAGHMKSLAHQQLLLNLMDRTTDN